MSKEVYTSEIAMGVRIIEEIETPIKNLLILVICSIKLSIIVSMLFLAALIIVLSLLIFIIYMPLHDF